MSQGQDWNAPGSQAYPQQPPVGQGYPQAPLVPVGAYGMPGMAPGAPVPPGFYYDQLSGLVLPDGTQLASVGRRIGSYFLAILLVIVTLGIGYLIWGAIIWAKGQTPTQALLGMQTWKPQTQANTSWGEQFLRELSRLLYAIPFIGWIIAIVSFFMFVSGKEHRSLHDSIGGTVVLYDPNKVLQPVQYQPAA
jgi:uncharacterized RDD family membrane protein YckC